MRPYDEERLPTYEWVMANVPEEAVAGAALLPTQETVVIERLFPSLDREGPDHCLHVVEFAGRLYIHDGHHRWVRGVLRGQQYFAARIVRYAHWTTEDCWCAPVCVPVEHEDGRIDWLYRHREVIGG